MRFVWTDFDIVARERVAQPGTAPILLLAAALLCVSACAGSSGDNEQERAALTIEADRLARLCSIGRRAFFSPHTWGAKRAYSDQELVEGTARAEERLENIRACEKRDEVLRELYTSPQLRSPSRVASDLRQEARLNLTVAKWRTRVGDPQAALTQIEAAYTVIEEAFAGIPEDQLAPRDSLLLDDLRRGVRELDRSREGLPPAVGARIDALGVAAFGTREDYLAKLKDFKRAEEETARYMESQRISEEGLAAAKELDTHVHTLREEPRLQRLNEYIALEMHCPSPAAPRCDRGPVTRSHYDDLAVLLYDALRAENSYEAALRDHSRRCGDQELGISKRAVRIDAAQCKQSREKLSIWSETPLIRSRMGDFFDALVQNGLDPRMREELEALYHGDSEALATLVLSRASGALCAANEDTVSRVERVEGLRKLEIPARFVDDVERRVVAASDYESLGEMQRSMCGPYQPRRWVRLIETKERCGPGNSGREVKLENSHPELPIDADVLNSGARAGEKYEQRLEFQLAAKELRALGCPAVGSGALSFSLQDARFAR